MKTRSCSYMPQSSGLVERFNGTLQKMLSLLDNESRSDWDDHLPYVIMAYRATTHDNTHCSPNLSCPSQYVEWVKSAIN